MTKADHDKILCLLADIEQKYQSRLFRIISAVDVAKKYGQIDGAHRCAAERGMV